MSKLNLNIANIHKYDSRFYFIFENQIKNQNAINLTVLFFTVYYIVFFAVASLGSIVLSYNFSFIFMEPRSCYYAMLSFNQVAGEEI
jgi:hypothetical protein